MGARLLSHRGDERRGSAASKLRLPLAGATVLLAILAGAALTLVASNPLPPNPAEWVCPSSAAKPTPAQIDAFCSGGSGMPDFGEPVTLPVPPA
ncbi:MAG: hypothetical protein ACRD2X_25375, partial [Vicinamibacteraceae bacterium]